MTQLTELEFSNLYNTALYKTAIGIHVIKIVGETHGYGEYTIVQSISAWCQILADGLQLNTQTVVEDATSVLKHIPKQFLESKKFAELMGELTFTISQANCMPTQTR